MIRGGFPSRSAGLVGLGLGHHGRHAFLIRQGRRKFSFRKQAVPERLPLIQQGHTPVEGLAYGDGRLVQGITRCLGLHRILTVVEPAGPVLRQGAGVVQAPDPGQLGFLVQDRPVDFVGVPGRHRETPVIVLDEGRQEGVGGVEVTDVPEPEFLDQPILQGLVGSFHPSLRLWAVGVDRLDIQSLQGTGERGQFALALRVIDPEDAVPVGVQGHRAPMLAQILRQGFHVGAGGLSRNQTQRQQAAGGIVDEDDEGARFSTVLEPGVGGTINLYQFSKTGPTRAARMGPSLPALLGLPESVGDHPSAQGLGTEVEIVSLGPLLAGQGGTEIGIAFPHQSQDSLTH